MAGEQLFINRPLPGAQINHAHPLAKGLVGCWLMNEQAGIRCIDSSPYGNHGTMVGFGVPANSRSTQGVKFDGVDDYIVISDDGLDDINHTKSFTVSLWVNLNNVTTDTTLISSTTTTSNRFAVRVLTGELRVGIYNGLTYLGQKSGAVLVSRWYHIVYSYKNNDGTLYINSNINTGGSGMSTTPTANTNVGSNTANIANTNGIINNIHIYNHALNKDEVKELYLNPYAMFKR